MTEAENPWEDAAGDPTWRQANFSMDDKGEVDENNVEHERMNDGRCTLAGCFFHSWYSADAAIGVAMELYSLFLRIQVNPPNTTVWLLFTLGILLICQATLGIFSIYTPSFGRMGLFLSAYFSAALSCVLFVCSMICLGMRQRIVQYLQEHQRDLCLSANVVNFISSHIHFVWAALLACSFIEAAKWFATLNYYAYMLEEDELSIQLLPNSSRQNLTPWWWSSRRRINSGREDLADPLMGPSWAITNSRSNRLDNGIDSGANASLWRRIFGGSRAGGATNVRDDTSVDFASVQEDWASRSEEDPFWWTRDEADTNNRS